MKPYQQQFIELAMQYDILRFGNFTLKSGRISPYFFNAGLFNTGELLAQIGQAYAKAIVNADIRFDVLFGPAYKGIPLATSTAVALAEHEGRNIPYAFNRKEAKDHGEGGLIVGHPLQGQVLIIDDVITAGTAIRESLAIIDQAGAKACGVVIAMDRQERGQDQRSAIQQIEEEHGIPVVSIIKLADLVEYLSMDQTREHDLLALREYRAKYGV